MKPPAPPKLLHVVPEMVQVGMFHLERLAKGGQPGYAPWARAMHTDLGARIRPVLPHLYKKLTEAPRAPSVRP